MKLGIRTKIVFITTGIVFVSAAATILTSGYVFTKEYADSLRSRSLVIGKGLKLQLERMLRLGVRMEDISGFDEQCRDVVQKHGGIELAMVASPDGRVLFHSAPAQHGKKLTDLSTLEALKRREDIVDTHKDADCKADRYDAVIPVFDVEGEHAASVIIGFPAELITGKVREMATYSAEAGLGFMALAIVSLLLALSFMVTKPLTKLLAVIQEIRGKGTAFAGRVEIDSGDEIGELAAAFNGMTEELRKTTVTKEELELKVEERTRQLFEAQEELVRREKLALLGRIAGNMGNELRNPLGVMSNAVYFLKTVMTDADETVREYLDIIKQEIDKSQHIISDLLDFVRTKTPQQVSVTVRGLADQSLGKCAIPGNVTVRVDIPETLPPVHVDPVQMGQVLQNLITNAVQAMPDGGALRIAARLISDLPLSHALSHKGRGGHEVSPPPVGGEQGEGEYSAIAISVTDTGVGITPENMDKLFQPLFTTRARGIGLGLAVSRKLTEANGGRIEVESRMGKGTTFSVILKVVQ